MGREGCIGILGKNAGTNPALTKNNNAGSHHLVRRYACACQHVCCGEKQSSVLGVGVEKGVEQS
eukprot:601250-Rhodomonas_salina.2